MSQDKHVALKEYSEENLSRGFIRASWSPASAAVLFIKKGDGGLRLCVDYRAIHEMTVKNRYRLPLIQETVVRLSKAKKFTKLDLLGTCNEVHIANGEEWKSDFRSRFGHYEYMVMPFGHTNAPASFQDFINDIPRQCLDSFA